MMKMKRLLAVGIIFFFIGVAVAPSINSSVVKTSDDLVEVTSQACGISGFGNTTVKLTKEQYQNLEQYLVDFRARLNQTTTREEAVPIFKDAVVELNKYGLLPKRMSVEKAEKLIIGNFENPRFLQLFDRIEYSYKNKMDVMESFCCFIAGFTSRTVTQGFILSTIRIILTLLFLPGIGSIISFLLNVNPIQVLSMIGFGGLYYSQYGRLSGPAHGWINTIGINNGAHKWSGDFYGSISQVFYLFKIYTINIPLNEYYPGVVGFSGIRVLIPDPYAPILFNSFYVGRAFAVAVNNYLP
jgi:hypothetical protein